MMKSRGYTMGFAFLAAVAVWFVRPPVVSAYYSYNYYPYSNYSNYGNNIDFQSQADTYQDISDYYDSLASFYDDLADFQDRDANNRTGFNVESYYPQFASPWSNVSTYPYYGGSSPNYGGLYGGYGYGGYGNTGYYGGNSYNQYNTGYYGGYGYYR